MKELYKNIFMEELPLPNNPLKYLNLYIVKGDNVSMMVDTGFNREDTKENIERVFKELNLKYENTILYLTHLHSDHAGLASHFQEKGMEVYMSKMDGDLLNTSIHKSQSMWVDTVEHSIWQGLKEDELDIEDHPGYKFRPLKHVDYKEAVIGETIKVGEYTFEIIDLKGHTPGITGLYEREHKILFCGDHILGKITPNITFWGTQYGDSLGNYFKNLDKVYDMEIDHLFSSHRFLVEDHRVRIDELKLHHKKRLDEAVNTLKKHDRATVRQVAKEMHWEISSKNWDNFPKAQKWFAAGEAHAHLEHLRAIGEAKVEEKDGIWYYSLA